jgi:hypothetical protein
LKAKKGPKPGKDAPQSVVQKRVRKKAVEITCSVTKRHKPRDETAKGNYEILENYSGVLTTP